MSKFQDLTGQKFGKLTVLERAENYYSKNNKPSVQWKCQCDCGNIKIIRGQSLRQGKRYHAVVVKFKRKLMVVNVVLMRNLL